MADELFSMGETAKSVGAQVKRVKMKAAKRKDKETGEQPAETFEVDVPATLADAIKILGEKETFGYFVRALAIELQGIKRRELTPAGDSQPRKKASYLDELGI